MGNDWGVKTFGRELMEHLAVLFAAMTITAGFVAWSNSPSLDPSPDAIARQIAIEELRIKLEQRSRWLPLDYSPPEYFISGLVVRVG